RLTEIAEENERALSSSSSCTGATGTLRRSSGSDLSEDAGSASASPAAPGGRYRRSLPSGGTLLVRAGPGIGLARRRTRSLWNPVGVSWSTLSGWLRHNDVQRHCGCTIR